MSESSAGAPPSLAQAQSWIGLGLDDVGGRAAGRIAGVYADAESGEPAWLVVGLEQRRRGLLGFGSRSAKAVVVPLRECAAMPGRGWTAQRLEAIQAAPAVDSARPLLREHEVAICEHYGVGERSGRRAEVAGRAEGSVTAQPA